MTYLSLARRVPETSAVEPEVLTWLYRLIMQVPLVHTAHRRFIAGALSQGVTQGLDLGTGPGYVNEIARVLRRPEPGEGKPGGRYYIADVCREVNPFQQIFAYASIPAVSLPFGNCRGFGGYHESVRAGYTRAEAQSLLAQSALPPGEVGLEATWFLPLLTIASKGRDGS